MATSLCSESLLSGSISHRSTLSRDSVAPWRHGELEDLSDDRNGRHASWVLSRLTDGDRESSTTALTDDWSVNSADG